MNPPIDFVFFIVPRFPGIVNTKCGGKNLRGSHGGSEKKVEKYFHFCYNNYNIISKNTRSAALGSAVDNRGKEKMIRTILWDIDGTLLNFLASEKAAIQSLFSEFGLGECTDEMIARYSAINRKYWERLERGEITKPEVLRGRYEEFFLLEGLNPALAPAFNDAYQLRLGDTVVYCDDSKTIVKSLRGRVRQYAVSNGTVIAQTKKLKNSGLDILMDGVFLSEDVGYEKPAVEFFDAVFRAIGQPSRNEVLIVGDSLTSDIRGGNNARIRTCWYNPAGLSNTAGVQVDFELRDLHGIYELLR